MCFMGPLMDNGGEGWLGQDFLLGRPWQVAVCSRLHGFFCIRGPSGGLGGYRLLLFCGAVRGPQGFQGDAADHRELGY